jgi:hypothetical protein
MCSSGVRLCACSASISGLKKRRRRNPLNESEVFTNLGSYGVACLEVFPCRGGFQTRPYIRNLFDGPHFITGAKLIRQTGRRLS